MTADERRADALRAVLARLIPDDATGPGALEAGVDDYVLRRYAGPLGTEAGAYAGWLDELDRTSIEAHGARFAEVDAAAQDAMLETLEARGLEAPEARRSAGFFETVLRHAREGMFGDPAHGGNRDGVGWDLLGYPDARRVWTREEQAVDVVILPRRPRSALPPTLPAPAVPPGAGA